MTEPSTPTIWALLIGIDCYLGRTIAGLPNYRSLGGCVNDIALMDDFLRTRLNVPEERIVKLTASGFGVMPQEPLDKWPTKANIVAAFRNLAGRAQPGDQVYIHYSGHGGRALSLYPDVKGKGDGVYDESLVPTDYGQIENTDAPEDRYLRDLELAYLLQEMVERGLIVSVVLDSCHSGGAARGDGSVEDGVRGGQDDRTPRTPGNLVAPPETLMAGWKRQTGGTRAAAVASGWLPDPDGYTLLAACQALEKSKEDVMPNGKKHGALSYWLWRSLQNPGLNWEMAAQKVTALVHGAFASQTPQLQGVGDRAVFGGARLALPLGVNVLEAQGECLRLNAGPITGAGIGAQYFVYRNGVTDFAQTDQRTAVVQITAPVLNKDLSISGVESWATIVRRLGDGAAIEPGAQALLFDPGQRQQRAVRLAVGGPAPAGIEEKAMADLSAAIGRSESRFIRLAAGAEAATFQVGLDAAGAYELSDASGQPLANVGPVPGNDANEAAYRLDHLARYFNVRQLDNPDSLSRLAGKLEVKLMRTPDEPFAEPGGIPAVAESQIYYLRIRNLFPPMEEPPSDADAFIEEIRRRTMNVTVLNLAPDWSIQRLIPDDDQKQFELGPGETLLLGQSKGQRSLPAFRSSIPAGMSEAEDCFLVFASTYTTSFDSLQLPALDDGGSRAALASPIAPEPERSWITAPVMLRVVRNLLLRT